jgi:hypothetical protein
MRGLAGEMEVWKGLKAELKDFKLEEFPKFKEAC